MFVLKINGEAVPSRSIISLVPDSSIEMVASSGGVEVGLRDPREYADWYSAFTYSKQQAMLNGGSGTGYEFTRPLRSLGVKTINNTIPDNLGNITLLGSRIVDVSVPLKNPNTVVVSSLPINADRRKLLQELYLFTMRLYTALNHCTSRLLEFDPSSWGEDNKLGKLKGSLLNYQANVARWNYLVWRSTYKQDIDVSRQNVALSLGYSCVACRVSGVTITTTIRKIHAHPTEIEGLGSHCFLTIYRQAVADDRQDKTVGVTTEIKKDDTKIFGFGQEYAYINWDTIEITQTLPAMVQSDKYSELFALAPCTGAVEYIYLDTETDPNSKKNEFEVTTTWTVTTATGGTEVMRRSETVSVAAINAKRLSEDDEDDGNASTE